MYNIFPGGKTLLHMMCTIENSNDMLDKLSKKCNSENVQLKKLEIEIHVPFLKNFEGKTPMDILYDKSDTLGMDKMLYNMTPYGIDHHSREIKHLIPTFI